MADIRIPKNPVGPDSHYDNRKRQFLIYAEHQRISKNSVGPDSHCDNRKRQFLIYAEQISKNLKES